MGVGRKLEGEVVMEELDPGFEGTSFVEVGPREVVLLKDRRKAAHNSIVGLGRHGRGTCGSRKPRSKDILGPVLPSKMPQKAKSVVVAVVLGRPKA